MEASELKNVKRLAEENAKLKPMYTELALELDMVVSKKVCIGFPILLEQKWLII